MEEILMKIFISVKYLLSLDRNRITMGYPKYYGSQWDIRVIVMYINRIAIGY